MFDGYRQRNITSAEHGLEFSYNQFRHGGGNWFDILVLSLEPQQMRF